MITPEQTRERIENLRLKAEIKKLQEKIIILEKDLKWYKDSRVDTLKAMVELMEYAKENSPYSHRSTFNKLIEKLKKAQEDENN